MQMLDVPLDVFFEVRIPLIPASFNRVPHCRPLLQIASYLNPIDILQLSRASKGLWNTLHTKASRHAWIVARQNVDPPLPDCPYFLSEPAFAYLVFERSCEVSIYSHLSRCDYFFLLPDEPMLGVRRGTSDECGLRCPSAALSPLLEEQVRRQ